MEPFGYFRANVDGWEDCAETDEGASPLYEAPRWRPIESAPKDGRAITVYCEQINKMAFVYWCKKYKEWTVQGTINSFTDSRYLSHWMPLPPAPQGE